MEQQNFTTSIVVDATPLEAFNSINNVAGWWTENLEGRSEQLDDEFTVRFGDVHVSTQKLVELVPGKKVVWLVTAGRLNFTDNMQEWTGTTISFDISEKDHKTQIRFTHHGLVPALQCYKDCSGAWRPYIQESLAALIATGKGKPTPKE